MTTDVRLLESTVNQTQELAAWVGAAEPGLPIPTCPEWTLTDLVGHVGATQRWVSRLVGERISDPDEAFSIGWESEPADPSTRGLWLSRGAQGVKATFAEATADRVVFDPSGGGDGMTFWSQRIFGEVSVHRIDAAFALGRDYQIDPTLAVAAIEDWLTNMASSGWAANVSGFADAMRGDGQTIAWVADDADGAWLLRRTEAPLILTHDRADADVTIHGPASELLQIVSRRLPLDSAESSTVVGDRHELTYLIEHMTWVGAG